MSRIIYLSFIAIMIAACHSQPSSHFLGTSPQAQNPISPGTDFGSGSDRKDRANEAHWFSFRDTPVSYCVNHSPDFGVSKEEAETVILLAFKKWESYLTLKQLPKTIFSITLKKEDYCTPSTDITFFLGGAPTVSQKAKQQFDSPFGFVQFDAKQKRGNVWIARQGEYGSLPNWSRENQLSAILLHEIGHIYGNGHLPNTIMRQHLASEITTLPKEWLTEIDHERVVVSCLDCRWTCETDARKKITLSRVPKQNPIILLTPTLWGSFYFRMESWTLLTIKDETTQSQNDVFWSLGTENEASPPQEQLAFALNTDKGLEGVRSQDLLSIKMTNNRNESRLVTLYESLGKMSVTFDDGTEETLSCRLD